ncbi:MAG: NAD(P)H-dependent oxidoreductase subunit E [Dehalococcoidia bacterium]|nr:NAD(P)H-dependent oxidoreductase subunit E [Dehalococcoidia bacterium]
MKEETFDATSEAFREAKIAVSELPKKRDQLLPALEIFQHKLHWLPEASIEYVANYLMLPFSEVYAIATGYSELNLLKPNPFKWHVCMGVACDLAGASELITCVDNVEQIDCQFLCALAPVVVDQHEQLYGRVTTDNFQEWVKK